MYLIEQCVPTDKVWVATERDGRERSRWGFRSFWAKKRRLVNMPYLQALETYPRAD